MDDPEFEVKRGPGQPEKLKADEETLKIIKGMGRIMATHREVAAVLGVAYQTWISFKQKYPEAEIAFLEGQDSGKASLRRAQFRTAIGEVDEHGKVKTPGNPTMQIWLGKQYLGQRDVRYTKEADFSDLTDEELSAEIDDILRELGYRTPQGGKARIAPPEDEQGPGRPN